jgi:1,4-alpha-glucan branching enzyme
VAAVERRAPDGGRVACIANLSPMPRDRHPIALPHGGPWREVLNTDASAYGGSGIGNLGVVTADGPSRGDLPASAEVGLPPLAVLWLAPG